MRKFCKASAGALLMVSGAIQFAAAAETGAALPKKTAPPRPEFSWTGFYLGGNVGGGTSRINVSGTGVFTIAGVADPFAFANSGTASGILAGGQLGFNYELPAHVVLGFEADLDGSSFHGLTTFCSTGTGGPLLGHGANCETSNNKLEQFSTVRGRVGYAFDKVLVYGTGGFAWERSSTSTIATCATVAGSCPGHGVKFTDGSSEASATLSGWAAGVGIEWALTPQWILRAEYLHLTFDRGAENFSASGTASRVPFAVSGRNSMSNDVDFARVGLSYLFNPDNPIDWGPGSSGTRTPGVGSTAFGSNANAVSDFFADWQALVAQVRANQPTWATPLITTTGLLLHRYRFDLAEQHVGNGNQTTILDGGKGVDLIVSDRTEIQITMPPYDIRNTPTGQGVFSGFADWGFVRVKQQLAAVHRARTITSSA